MQFDNHIHAFQGWKALRVQQFFLGAFDIHEDQRFGAGKAFVILTVKAFADDDAILDLVQFRHFAALGACVGVDIEGIDHRFRTTLGQTDAVIPIGATDIQDLFVLFPDGVFDSVVDFPFIGAQKGGRKMLVHDIGDQLHPAKGAGENAGSYPADKNLAKDDALQAGQHGPHGFELDRVGFVRFPQRLDDFHEFGAEICRKKHLDTFGRAGRTGWTLVRSMLYHNEHRATQGFAMTEPRHFRGAGQRKTVNETAEKELCAAFTLLETTEECRRFLYDLCTPKEIADMADRWWVARLLNEGRLSYRDIHQLTGVSVTTIGRVARFLEQENYQGYRQMLDRRVRK